MNLGRLFQMQRKLDDRIKQDRHIAGVLSKKRLALQVEFAELAQELPESFKFWSNKQNNYETALVELVDCLHFILSIGLELEYVQGRKVETIVYRPTNAHSHAGIERVFTLFISTAGMLDESNYIPFLNDFLALVETLGFTWIEVEEAYLQKNQINHARQAEGY